MRRGGTAFVLTGGGNLGAVQVGMATALHAHGIDPDILVGTSVGAVNAAYLAGPGTTEERLAVWPHSGPVCAGGTCSVSSRDGGDGPPSEQNRRCSPATRCACCSRDTWATTPSRTPGYDGAIGHPGTLAHADGCGVDEIYLLPAGYPCAAAAPSTALGTALTAVSVLLHRQLIDKIRAYTGHARLHVVPPLCPLAISPADFTHVDSLIHCAHASTDPVAALPPGRGGAGHRRRSTRPPRPTPSPQIHRRRRPPPAASSLIGDPRS